MRGMTETTRGATTHRAESRVVKRNATIDDLAAALATFKGKPVKLPNRPSARFLCVDVRLDSLKRLIFDLEREVRSMGEEEFWPYADHQN